MNYELYSDGGSRGNPGPAACAYVLLDSNKQLVWFDGAYIGETTNNQAEYQGLLLGLKYIQKSLPSNESIICHLDSELVVKQLNGEYKIKNEALKVLYRKAQAYQDTLTITFIHVRREQNKHADKLLNIILDTNQ